MSEQTHQKYPPSVQHGIPRLSPAQNGWKSVAIGKLVTEVVRPVEMDDDEIYTLVTAKRSRGGIVKREELKGREIAVKKQFYIQEGDFVISKRQIVHGACGFVPKELEGSIVSNEYLVLNFTDKIIPQFWDFLTHTIYFQQVCFHSSIGVHVEKMLFNVSRWYQWKVNIPTLKEQEKIASFLGAVDTRLRQLRRKHELLQTYKRGVMQKLFSQQIRFKCDDGKAFPDWEEKKLGEVGKFKSGVGFPELEQGGRHGIPFFKVSDMNLSGNEKTMRIANNYVNESQVKNLKLSPIEQESIIFAKVGAAIFLERKRKAKTFLIDNNMMAFIPNNGINYNFLFILFCKIRLSKQAQVGALPSYNGSDIAIIKVKIPCTGEQEKIANLLTAIDQKIELVAKQIELTEQFKKGLLQKMFV